MSGNVSVAQEIGIIAHPNNSVNEISQEDAVNIFMGRYRQFADGKLAKPIDNAAIKSKFYLSLVNKSNAEIKAYWARLIFAGHTLPPENVQDSDAVIDRVLNDPQAISYVDMRKADAKVKVLFVLRDK
ncbi:MAG TPA: hypothetical protein VGD04_09560 [Methylophilus sp.]